MTSPFEPCEYDPFGGWSLGPATLTIRASGTTGLFAKVREPVRCTPPAHPKKVAVRFRAERVGLTEDKCVVDRT
jgi:hypothetical protein